MNSFSPWLTGRVGSKLPPVFSQRDPKELNPHTWNSAIYGKDEDVTELISLIRDSQWVRPLVVTNSGTIISGHRRWKAVLELGWESVPVEVRQFSDETAELQALLLENASRIKTVEQKVREASAWKEVEKEKAKKRQLAAQNNTAGRAVPENFPELLKEKGETRDHLAKLVGLGSGRTYSKAAKVVDAMDEQTDLGNLETAQTLRRVLNEKSVDAAVKLLKHISLNGIVLRDSLDKDSKTTSNCSENAARDPQHSCWNCQHRGELIENHSFYCYRLGALSLIDNSADTLGASCELWSYLGSSGYDEAKNKPQPTDETFTLTFPAHLRPLLEDAARTTGMNVVEWATKVLESVALATSCITSCTESSATLQTDKTSLQVTQSRSP